MSKANFFALLTFLLCCFVAIVSFIFFSPVVRSSVEINVHNNSGPILVCRTILRDKTLSHPYIFCTASRLYSLLFGSKYTAGLHSIPSYATSLDIIRILSSDVVIPVIIREGLTSHEIYDIIMNTKGLIGDAKITDINLGVMPETYHVSYGSHRSDLVLMMRKTLQDFMEQEWQRRDDGITFSPKETLIIASIVESETPLSSDRPIVASVFINRIKKKMRLETCTSIIYAINDGKSLKIKRSLTYDDLYTKSPYNTYRNTGLPPTQICHPGRAAILAVLHPAKTDYLFFVSDSNKNTVFNKNFTDHVNVKQGLKRSKAAFVG